MSLEELPGECFNHICTYASSAVIPPLSTVSKSIAIACRSQELWNLFLCQRLWTVDPSSHLDEEANFDDIHWKEKFKSLVCAEHEHQLYLDRLKQLDVEGWLERHFIGSIAPQWNGWEKRYWTWDSEDSSFRAWDSDGQRTCFAAFPITPISSVHRLTPEEQVELTAGTDNPMAAPRPFCFTIQKTSFPMLWACRDEKHLQLWLDKISVTLHPLKFEGKTYRAPPKYLLRKKKV